LVPIMSGIRLIGHVLLWLGFLVGAFVAVRSVEVEGAPWSTISWPAYGMAMFVATAGVVVLRSTKTAAGVASAEEAHAIDELDTILARLQSTLEGWSQQSDELDVYAVHGMIDESLAEDFGRFADLREAMIPEFGLDHYARIMTEFALAERTVNRTWSASADGYIDEVRDCLSGAVVHLRAARKRLRDAVEEQKRVVA
jgi:hypothetical protein